MKVSICEKCKYHKRATWSHYYQPRAYHAIGMSHAYGYCSKYKDRCLNIKKCDENKINN